MKRNFHTVVVLSGLIVLLSTQLVKAGIEGDLVFKQDGKDLLITGTGYTTRGLFIVQTGWYEKSRNEIVLTYVQIYNKDTVRRSVMDFQVTWRLKNRKKEQMTFTVQQSGVVMLTPEELRTLLDPGVETHESRQSVRGDSDKAVDALNGVPQR